jgi:type II secretory ATPase GspE/PulE/Tfp pilus assembly ATPase PilB-like protein
MHPVGCTYCRRSGFKGRLPISEAFLSTDELLRAVADREPSSRIEAMAKDGGLDGMAADGYRLALTGVTTLEEVAAAIHG